jgi:hypothetical protein
MDTYCEACEKNAQTGEWECDTTKINSGRFPFTEFLQEDGGTIKPPTTTPKGELPGVGPSVEDLSPPTNGDNESKIPKDLRGLEDGATLNPGE